MKIEVGLDDRTLLAIDKLTYALQQMVRPECHYTGAQAATPPVSPPAKTPTMAEYCVPVTPPAPPVTPTPPVVTPPAPVVTPTQLAADPFAVGEPQPRTVSDDELRSAMQAVLTQQGGKDAVGALLAKKYKVPMVRELNPSRRAELVEDLARGIPAIVAMVGAAG